MTDLRKAATMGLLVLLDVYTAKNMMSVSEAINDLEAALAQPEQEPVAWIYDWYGHKSAKEPRALVKDWIASVYSEVSDPTIGAHNIRPLYAAPPRKEWVGLTDEEIDSCFEDHGWSSSAMYHLVVNALEAKLKDKNDHSI